MSLAAYSCKEHLLVIPAYTAQNSLLSRFLCLLPAFLGLHSASQKAVAIRHFVKAVLAGHCCSGSKRKIWGYKALFSHFCV